MTDIVVSNRDGALTCIEERGVRSVQLWFTDILGQLKSFSVSAAQLRDGLEYGFSFDGSSITGFNPVEESDMIAIPDPATFALLPWRPQTEGVARMFCDVLAPDGTPYEGDPLARPAPRCRARA